MKNIKATIDKSMAYNDEYNDEVISLSSFITDLVTFEQVFELKSAASAILPSYKFDNVAMPFQARKIAFSSFNRNPNVMTLCGVRVKPMIETLKSLGELTVVQSSASPSGDGLYFCAILRFLEKGSSVPMFICLPEVEPIEPLIYKDYIEDIFYLGKEGCILIDIAPVVYYNPEASPESITDIFNKVQKVSEFIESDEDVFIEMIIQTNQGLKTQKVNFDVDCSDNLNIHYGKNFNTFHDKLIERIKSRDKGIAMFHGPPGTGKTHYIRRLLPELSAAGKRPILIPKHVLGALESPDFNHFMLSNFIGEKIVFVIEDAESIITKRKEDGTRSELVSTLLNITDGLLNDIFSIQVILTFNTDLKSIDDALLRKGRLIAKYKFGNLAYDEASILSKHIGVVLPEERSYSLAEVYSLRESEEDEILMEQSFSAKAESMGF